MEIRGARDREEKCGLDAAERGVAQFDEQVFALESRQRAAGDRPQPVSSNAQLSQPRVVRRLQLVASNCCVFQLNVQSFQPRQFRENPLNVHVAEDRIVVRLQLGQVRKVLESIFFDPRTLLQALDGQRPQHLQIIEVALSNQLE